MGTWNVDPARKPGILWLELAGFMKPDEMGAFVEAHNAAIDGFDGADYRVFCDVRELKPLPADSAALFERAKQYSSSQSNFRGSAVWVASAMVAMQHRRTSVQGGVMDTELISEDEAALWQHLETVNRR